MVGGLVFLEKMPFAIVAVSGGCLCGLSLGGIGLTVGASTMEWCASVEPTMLMGRDGCVGRFRSGVQPLMRDFEECSGDVSKKVDSSSNTHKNSRLSVLCLPQLDRLFVECLCLALTTVGGQQLSKSGVKCCNSIAQ